MSPARPLACIASFHVGQRVEADLLGVVTREECGARGPATGRVIKLCVADAVGGEGVEVWCGNFAAIAAGVGEAHVVGEEDYEIGWPRRRRGAEILRGKKRADSDRHDEDNFSYV